jgi:hypothetical protein
MIPGSHVVTNPFIVRQNSASQCRQERSNRYKTSYGNNILTAVKLLLFDILPREHIFNQNHFLAMTAQELSKENMNGKGRVGKSQLVAPMDNSMCHHGRKV